MSITTLNTSCTSEQEKLIRAFNNGELDNHIDILNVIDRGDLEDFVQLMETLPENEIPTLEQMLIQACVAGKIPIINWLVSNLPITREHVVKKESPIAWACMGGHQNVVMWLTDYFHLTREELTAVCKTGSTWAREIGNKDMAEWVTTFAND